MPPFRLAACFAPLKAIKNPFTKASKNLDPSKAKENTSPGAEKEVQSESLDSDTDSSSDEEEHHAQSPPLTETRNKSSRAETTSSSSSNSSVLPSTETRSQCSNSETTAISTFTNSAPSPPTPRLSPLSRIPPQTPRMVPKPKRTWPTHLELRREMYLPNDQSSTAHHLIDLFATLNRQKKHSYIVSATEREKKNDQFAMVSLMFSYVVGSSRRKVYDEESTSTWVLCESYEDAMEHPMASTPWTYFVYPAYQPGVHKLQIAQGRPTKHLPPNRVTEYDMSDREHRLKFVDVINSVFKAYPPKKDWHAEMGMSKANSLPGIKTKGKFEGGKVKKGGIREQKRKWEEGMGKGVGKPKARLLKEEEKGHKKAHARYRGRKYKGYKKTRLSACSLVDE